MTTATLTVPKPAIQPAAAPAPDLAALKTRQQAAWTSGNYAVVGTTLQIVGENLCEALDLHSGQTVLDVAAGNGNATLAAARRWCDVTSTDYVSALLERGRMRAEAEGLTVEFQQADAEALPFTGNSFDAVVSTFGVMFTANQDKAAAELLRVCKPGGKIGLANWTPNGFIGQLFKTLGQHMPPPAGVKSPALWGTRARIDEMFGPQAASIETLPREFMFRYRSAQHWMDVFKTLGRHVPPPPGAKSPALWGTRARIDEMFGAQARSITAEPRIFAFRYRSPGHWLDVFKTYYGPLLKTFAALAPPAQEALHDDIMALIARMNHSGDGTMVVPSEYLEVIVIKR